jgi:hypothetical protein
MPIKRLALLLCFAFGLTAAALDAQEAASGFDLRATLSGVANTTAISEEPARSRSAFDGGATAVFAPTWKLNQHWLITGAVRAYLEPDAERNFSDEPRSVVTRLLHASVGYSQFWTDGSVLVRAGKLTTAFGSYLLHYDDAEDPFINRPKQYGYYDTPVSPVGLFGVQVDISHHRWDARAQLVNSSPSNPRSPLANDQYANWAGGAGYTIRQGFRVGASTYQGPYLNRDDDKYLPGEGKPRNLPARAYGLDFQWARRHWNVQGELQQFQFTHSAVPTVHVHSGYVEVRRALYPRWYVATRAGFMNSSEDGRFQTIAAVVGYRLARDRLVKFGYEYEHAPIGEFHSHRTLSVQFVTALHPLSFAHN